MADAQRQTSRAVGAVWLFGAASLILFATLPPQPEWTGVKQPILRSLVPGNFSWIDVGQNVALYVPLGLVVAVRGGSLLRVCGVAAAFSLATELLQYYIPGRHPAGRDVLVNSLGAAVGYVAVKWPPLGRRVVHNLESIQQWLKRPRSPDQDRASLLLLAWSGGIAVIVTITAALLSPAPPPGGNFVSIASPTMDRATGALRIGSNGWPRGFFRGTIDEVRIYERARTGDEIARDMERSSADIASDPHLLAAYSFDANGSTVARDETRHGHDAVVSHASWTERGRHGGALIFDGVRSEVVVPRAEALNVAEGMTVEAWIVPSGREEFEGTIVSQSGDVYYIRESSNAVPLRASSGGRFGTVPRQVRLAEPLRAGEWTHLAATYDGQLIRLFVNGSLRAAKAHWSPHRPTHASLNGVELGPGRIADGDAFVASLRRDVTLAVTLACGRPDDTPAPAFLAGGLQSSEVLSLVVRGDDLFVKPLTWAERFGFASLATRVSDALHGCRTGDRVALTLKGRLQDPRIDRAGQVLKSVPPGIGSTWRLLIHSHLLPGWMESTGTFLWLVLLAIPLGLWARRTAMAAAGIAVVIMTLMAIPYVFHVRSADLNDLASLLAGGGLGAIYRRRGERSG